MNAKRLLFLTLMALCAASAWAYNFSAVAPSGQTLYYNIVNGHAEVVRPGTGSNYNNYVTGDLIIPSSVTHNGTNYAVTALAMVSSYGTFDNCSRLTSVTIPSSVTSIGGSAFYNCSGLTSVTIPSSVISIGYFAFSYCSSLATTIYTGTVAQWCNITFGGTNANPLYYSHSLTIDGAEITNLVIPEGVTSISRYAFYGYRSLTSVTIPSSDTSIGGSAFDGCSGLTVMRMKPATPPTLSNTSSICNRIIDLVVPRNSYYAYTHAGTNYTRHRIYCDTVFLSVNVNDTARGGVIGYDSIFPYPDFPPDTITLTALPNYGYHFGHWENGDTSSVRRLANITHDTSLTAYFDKNKYTIYANADTSIHGYINAPAQGNYLDEVAITAHASHGYHFTHWQDGNADNPRTFVLTQDTHFVAYYDKNVYTLTFQSDNSDMGIVNTTSVSSEYLDTTMLIYTTPMPHYHFVRWSDNNTENPRRFVFDDNRTYTAYFAIDEHTVSVQADNLAHGTVSGAGTREYGQPITVSATPYSGYQFAHWSDGSTYNPYTFAVLEDKSLTAIFIADGEPWQDTVVVYDTAYITLHDTTYINVPVHDTTYVNVPVHDTTYITVMDTLWLTQADTVWLHDTVIVHDTVYITQEGIGDVDALNAKVYTSQGQIVVEGANGNMVMFYDVNGHMLATKRDEYAPLRFDAPVSGTYMIKIGNHPARKMVVVR